jgi:hypothetical protein
MGESNNINTVYLDIKGLNFGLVCIGVGLACVGIGLGCVGICSWKKTSLHGEEMERKMDENDWKKLWKMVGSLANKDDYDEQ